MDPMKFRLAKYHGSEVLCLRVERARNLIGLCSALVVRRINKKSYIRVLPIELIRMIDVMCYPNFQELTSTSTL